MSITTVVTVVLTVIVLRITHQFQLGMAEAAGFESPGRAWTSLLLILTLPFGALIHEAGHWLMGIALGQKCSRFAIGPLELSREGVGWKLRLIRIRVAGVVALLPSTFVRFRWQRALVAAGGPLASLVSGVVFTALAMRSHTAGSFWLWCACFQWSIAFLASLLPARSGASLSDGCLIWEAIRGGNAFEWTRRDLLTPSAHATPLRPRDFPEDLILRLTMSPPASEWSRYNYYLAYTHYLDRGDTHAAGRYLTKLSTQRMQGDPPAYALEAAYFLALHDGNPLAAERWLNVATGDGEPWVRQRTQAAIDMAAGRPEQARGRIVEALATLRALPPCGAYDYEVDLLEHMRSLTAAPLVHA